jgi:hypothetical protein
MNESPTKENVRFKKQHYRYLQKINDKLTRQVCLSRENIDKSQNLLA